MVTHNESTGVALVAGLRTPFAKQATSYRDLSALDLGTAVVRELLERVAEDTKEHGKIENFPKMEGRQMVMMIGPLPQK